MNRTWYFKLLETNYFEEKRNPHVGIFFDSSKKLKGRQSIENRLMYLRSFIYPWNNPLDNLSDDYLRTILKFAFFPYYKDNDTPMVY